MSECGDEQGGSWIIRREPGPYMADEEFAEKMYEVEAPVPPQFDEKHEISMTGCKLHPGTPGETDAPPPEPDNYW